MATMKCITCGGVYETEQSRGARYFHACPPIERARVVRLGATIDVNTKDVQPTDTVLKLFNVPMADARDENVKITGTDKQGNPTTAPKSEGKGATDVTAAK